MMFKDLQLTGESFLLKGKITTKEIINELILNENELIGVLIKFGQDKIKLTFKTYKQLKREGVLQ